MSQSPEETLPPPLPPPLQHHSRSYSSSSSSEDSVARSAGAFGGGSSSRIVTSASNADLIGLQRSASASSIDENDPPDASSGPSANYTSNALRREPSASSSSSTQSETRYGRQDASSFLARVSPALAASRYSSTSPASVGLGSRSPFNAKASPAPVHRSIELGHGVQTSIERPSADQTDSVAPLPFPELQRSPISPIIATETDVILSPGGTVRTVGANGLPSLLTPTKELQREFKISMGSDGKPERPPKSEARLSTPTKRASLPPSPSVNQSGDAAASPFAPSPAYEELKRILDREDEEEKEHLADNRRQSGSIGSNRTATESRARAEEDEEPASNRRASIRSLSSREDNSASPWSSSTHIRSPTSRFNQYQGEQASSSPRSYTALDNYSSQGSSSASVRKSDLVGSERTRAASAIGDTQDRDDELVHSMRRLSYASRGLKTELSSASPRVRRKLEADGLPDSPSFISEVSAVRLRPGLPREFARERGRKDSPPVSPDVERIREGSDRRQHSRSEVLPRSDSRGEVIEFRRRSAVRSGNSVAGSSTDDVDYQDAHRPRLERDRTLRALSSITNGDDSFSTSDAASATSPRRAHSIYAESWSGRMTRSDSVATSRSYASSRMGHNARGTDDHHALLEEAYERFEQYFSTLNGSTQLVAESKDLVKRMHAMMTTTTQLNHGLRTLADLTSADRGIRAQGGVATLASIDRHVASLWKTSNEQVRSLTEEMIAFTRVQRERDRVGADGSPYSRSVSRASTYRDGPGTVQSPPRRVGTSSPFEGSTSSVSHRSSLSSSATRQSLRDPLANVEQSRRAGSVASRPLGSQNSLDSPSPAGRREPGSSRSPLSTLEERFSTPAREARRQSITNVNERHLADTPSRLGNHSLSGSLGRTSAARAAKSSSTSSATVRPSSPRSRPFSSAASTSGVSDFAQEAARDSPGDRSRMSSSFGMHLYSDSYRSSADARGPSSSRPAGVTPQRKEHERSITSASSHSEYSTSPDASSSRILSNGSVRRARANATAPDGVDARLAATERRSVASEEYGDAQSGSSSPEERRAERRRVAEDILSKAGSRSGR